MVQKEISEIRRHLTAERNCIGKIYGCYVNCVGEIIASVEQSVALMPEDEVERFLALFKKLLSGGVGRSMMDIPFSTATVESGEDYALLTKLRATSCGDAETRTQFFRRVIESVDLKDENYLILLASDTYDVPWRSKDGESTEKQSDTVFTYLLCAVCPVADGKTTLGYDVEAGAFHNCTSAQSVSAPEFGFLFPAFDDRKTNIYNALYYSRSMDDVHDAFIENFLHAAPPMAAGVQRETFEHVLTETLAETCRFDVVQSVHEQLREKIEAHKEAREPEPLEMTPREVGDILRAGEVPEERIEAFQEKCTESFGAGVTLQPGNIVDTKKFRLSTPQVKISVTPEYSSMLETRRIDGRKYLLIPVDDGVEVNGVAVRIPDGEDDNE